MKRTPIIVIGQVYLHTELNEYLVVTKSTRGEIFFSGNGFSGRNEVERFLERFGPVDPSDLEDQEAQALLALIQTPNPKLSTGWVTPEDELPSFEEDDDLEGDE